MNKKHVKMSVAIIVCIVLLSASALYILTVVNHNSIDCEAIYKESSESESRGIAVNLTPEAIQKCYND